MGEWRHPDHYTDWAKAYAVTRMRAEIGEFLDHCLPLLRDAARAQGYALAVHGSLSRDLDLIAVPWTDDATGLDTLVAALAEATKEATGWGHISGRSDNSWRSDKPHGRVAVTILASAELSLDISIVPALAGNGDQ